MTRFKFWKKFTLNLTEREWKFLEKKSQETMYSVNLIIRDLIEKEIKGE